MTHVQKSGLRHFDFRFCAFSDGGAGAGNIENAHLGRVCATKKVEEFKAYIKEKYVEYIHVVIDFASDPEEFYNAARSGNYHIITSSHNLLKDKKNNYILKKVVIPIDLKNVPNYESVNPDLKFADYATSSDDLYSVPFATGIYALAYNADVFPTPLDSWNVFWDPQYASKYVIARDYPEVNVYIALLALGRDFLKNVDSAIGADDNELIDKVGALAKNAKSFWKGVDTADDLENAELATSWGFSIPELQKRGKNWKIAFPKEGSLVWVDNYVLCQALKDNPKLLRFAEEWLNFTLSPSYQADVVVRGLGSLPVNPKAKELLTPEEQANMLPEDVIKRDLLWPTLEEIRTRNIMINMWNKAMK